jgi:hypothetical protein
MPTKAKTKPAKNAPAGDSTVQELRALAKARGLTHYSRLTKTELLTLLARATPAAPPRAQQKSTKKVARKTTTTRKAVKKTRQTNARKTAGKTSPGTKSVKKTRAAPRATARPAKKDMSSVPTIRPGVAHQRTPLPADRTATTAAVTHRPAATPPARNTAPRRVPLATLPPLITPMLTLMAQQPGVLHAYWSIDPAKAMPLGFLRLRLSRISETGTQFIEEIALPELQGSRYFHVAPPFWSDGMRAEIGYHSHDGRFLVMYRQDVLSLPTHAASAQVDPAWPVSDTAFRALYGRSGGHADVAVPRWRTSFSS